MTSTHFCRSPFLPKCGQNCLFPIIDRWSLNMTFHHFGGSLLAKIGQSSKMIFHHFGSATPSNKRDCCRDQKENGKHKKFHYEFAFTANCCANSQWNFFAFLFFLVTTAVAFITSNKNLFLLLFFNIMKNDISPFWGFSFGQN